MQHQRLSLSHAQCPKNQQVTNIDSRFIAAYLTLITFLNFVLVHKSCKVTVGSIITYLVVLQIGSLTCLDCLGFPCLTF